MDPTRHVATLHFAWVEARKRAGVTGRWHDLRHTVVTQLAEPGATPAAIKASIGHVSQQMLDRYSHGCGQQTTVPFEPRGDRRRRRRNLSRRELLHGCFLTGPKSFGNPEQAADALIEAAEKFDGAALVQIFGPGGEDIAFTGDLAQDRKHAADFVAEAQEKKSVAVDPKTGSRAFLLVGNEDWPFPVPIVKRGGKWSFDADAGRKELLYRRIGANELDAIDICHGYVEAQYDYAFRIRQGYDVTQYAQRIISTPGTQDGLA